MKPFSWSDRMRSFRYAFRGMGRLLRYEHNAWLHACAAIGVLLLGWWLDLSSGEWIAVMGCIGGVFSAEAMNTAIETLCDHVSPEYAEAIGKTKDLAAAAVLCMALAALLVGAIVFLPKLFALWHG